VSLLQGECFVEQYAVPPLAAALGFSCGGLTAASTGRFAVLALCSAGYSVVLGAVQCCALYNAGRSIALLAV